MCDNLNGANAPFCSPRDNTQGQVGRSVDVTWDPRFFNRTDGTNPRQIFIQADFGNTGPGDPSFGGLDGFTSYALDPSSGRFTWNIVDQFLTSGGAGTTSRGARLFISQEVFDIDETGTNLPQLTQSRLTGPRVVIISRDNGVTNMPNPLSIALPVGLGVFVLMIIGVFFCVRRWRRAARNKKVTVVNNKGVVGVTGVSPGMGKGKKGGGWFSKRGYGIGKSRSQRMRGGDDIEIVHSTHMNASGGGVRMNFMGMGGVGGGGGNVFRDEMRRQDRSSDYM